MLGTTTSIMVKIHTINVEPALLNSSCAWASDLVQLQELYDSPYVGAVTTRTATLHGFKETEANTVSELILPIASSDSHAGCSGFEHNNLHQFIWIFSPSLARLYQMGLYNSHNSVAVRLLAYQTHHYQHYCFLACHPPGYAI